MEPKFIEIDGAKFQVDPNDETKAKMDADGKPVPFVEEKKGDESDKNKVDLSKVSIEDLRKANPDIEKALKDVEDIKKAEEDRKKKEQEDNTKKLQEENKWKELYETEKEKNVVVTGDLTKANELLKNHQDTIKSILDNVLEKVPADKKNLIPKDYSPRKQLEYVTSNADIFGVNVTLQKGGGVPDNDKKVTLDDESKLTERLEELRNKKPRTYLEDQEMLDTAKKIKEVRLANEQKK